MGNTLGTRQTVGRHALVLGGSLAGLAAAAALAERFERVTIVERDVAPPIGEARRGVPQGRHAHLLLPAGMAALADLVPGAIDDVVGQGGHVIPASEIRFHIGGGRLALTDDELAVVGATRPLIEGAVRARVTGLANVVALEGHDVLGPTANDDGSTVTGARVRRRGAERTVADDGDDGGHEGAAGETIPADLVVDATGRGSRAPQWLRGLGYEAPATERLEVGVRYTTRLFRRDALDLGGCRHVTVSVPPGRTRGGLALAVEGDRWLVTLVGLRGDRAPEDLDGFTAYARSLWSHDLFEVVAGAEPIGDAATGSFPSHQRRRWDRLRRFPERYVVTGDAVCSLNPLYGQGMSVALLEARALGEVIDRHGLDRVGPRSFRAAQPAVARAWTGATGADLADPAVDGPRPPSWRFVNAYVQRVVRRATVDPVVADAFLAVQAMVAPPSALLRPALMARVLWDRRPRSTVDDHTAPASRR